MKENYSNQNQHFLITQEDKNYPTLLKEIKRAPRQLYARGNLDLLNSTCIAIVGTRANTPYGESMALYFARALVSYGFTIVSGLAFGIDAVVHEKTIEYGGKTIAVLGNGIDSIHPRCHENLGKKILENEGLILSEYAPGVAAYKSHFPMRNRIISGLSIGTLIIEAPKKSGALITARYAFEQNRDVFAIPGDLSRPTTEGNNHLIANEMARLVRTPEDIISHLNHQPELLLKPLIKRSVNPKLTTQAQKEVWALLSSYPIYLDEIIKSSRLSVSEAVVAISYLELKGLAKQTSHGQYIRGP
ncbi:MAG: DNA-processing protein DprA [Candidatus Peregrinibacteria bacterium]|nr:DNA-processing protein DprA [Candidatus Peregrinibacteria bacterium]